MIDGEKITLQEAMDFIPPAYEVVLRRKGGNGGWYFSAARPQNGGEFSIMTKTHATWQQAFLELWERI